MNAPAEQLAPVLEPAPGEPEAAGQSLWQDAWRRLRKNRAAVAAGLTLLAIILFCVVGPWLSPWRFDVPDLEYGPQGPSLRHWFGTDALGRDLMVRCMMGGRLSLLIGLAATVVSLSIGVTVGAVSGYFGGRVDALLMRLVDVLYTMPFIFFAILLLAIFGRSLVVVFVALGAVTWLTMARIVRGQVLSLRNAEFVQAARTMGVSHLGIIFRHLIPNTLGPTIVYATLTVPAVMLQEAFLSFLGLGIAAPDASWGLLVSDGAANMTFLPHELIFPALLLSITLLCLNFLGDGLRDALDPRMRFD
ncbi:MAG: ABC transporter permease subunit [Myxococcaceae bacterium]|nr:ABC transporter permease subunit [Myxococcaceae bacterium]